MVNLSALGSCSSNFAIPTSVKQKSFAKFFIKNIFSSQVCLSQYSSSSGIIYCCSHLRSSFVISSMWETNNLYHFHWFLSALDHQYQLTTAYLASAMSWVVNFWKTWIVVTILLTFLSYLNASFHPKNQPYFWWHNICNTSFRTPLSSSPYLG